MLKRRSRMCEIETFTMKATKPDDETEFQRENADGPQNITKKADRRLW